MPQDFRDFEHRGPPFNNVLGAGANIDMTGGYTDDNNGNGWHVGGYRSTAVRVAPGAASVQVSCFWTQAAGGAFETYETKDTVGIAPTVLLFVNQGHHLERVEFFGGGGSTDYAIVESNQLPLLARAARPALPYAAVSIEAVTLTAAHSSEAAALLVPFGTAPPPVTIFNTSDASSFDLDAGFHGIHTDLPGLYALIVSASLSGPAGHNNDPSDVFGIFGSHIGGGTSPFTATLAARPTLGRSVAGATVWLTSELSLYDVISGPEYFVLKAYQTTGVNCQITIASLFLLRLGESILPPAP